MLENYQQFIPSNRKNDGWLFKLLKPLSPTYYSYQLYLNINPKGELRDIHIYMFLNGGRGGGGEETDELEERED